MNVMLLDRTRRIYKLLREWPITGEALSNVLASSLNSNVVMLDADGGLIASACTPEIDIVFDEKTLEDPLLNARLLDILSTHDNVLLNTLGIVGYSYVAIVTQAIYAGKRLGTIVTYRDSPYDIDDIITCEFATAVLGEMLGFSWTQTMLEEEQLKNVFQSTLDTISKSELHALCYLFDEFEGDEGNIKGSLVADNHHLIRSTVITIFRKLECAGVITARSTGRHGTHVTILNRPLLEKLIAYAKEHQSEFEDKKPNEEGTNEAEVEPKTAKTTAKRGRKPKPKPIS